MTAKIIEIADGVVDLLNAGSFSQAFTATRSYRPAVELPALVDLHVTVVPRGLDAAFASRDGDVTEYTIDIAVRQKLTVATLDVEADALMALAEEIVGALRGIRLADPAGGFCVRTENVPVFSTELLETSSVFLSLATATFKVFT